nr:glycosyltransferase [Sunxiuqinia sp.]
MPVPICLFTYNRLGELQRTVDALKRNCLAAKSELFIFSDGAKSAEVEHKVAEVRKYLKTISGFKSVSIEESPINRGLASSIIAGVSRIVQQYGKVIVLEDDLITTPNFLNFLNQALDYYQDHPKIMSISGYSMDLPSLKDYEPDFYLGYRAASWGWGIWKDRWELVDWDMKSYRSFKWDFLRQVQFMRGGMDMPYMLWKQMNGRLDSWAIRLGYCQFEKDLLTVFPSKSKLKSIGFGSEATHTRSSQRFACKLDEELKTEFIFDPQPCLEPVLAKEFREKFSLKTRLSEKFKFV